MIKLLGVLLTTIVAQAQITPFVNPFWAVPDNNLLTDLQAYWKADEASGVMDDSHSGNHDLTEYGGTLAAGTGKLNGDRVFGTGEVVAAADGAWNEANGSSFTFVCWVNIANLPGAGTAVYLMNKGINPNVSYSLELVQSGGGAKSFRLTVFDTIIGTVVDIVPSPAVTTATWYFVACRYDVGDNGYSVSCGQGSTLTHGTPGTAGGTAMNTAEDFSLGGKVTSDHVTISQTYDGQMDEAALWKRELTDAELTLIFNSGTPLPFSSYN